MPLGAFLFSAIIDFVQYGKKKQRIENIVFSIAII